MSHRLGLSLVILVAGCPADDTMMTGNDDGGGEPQSDLAAAASVDLTHLPGADLVVHPDLAVLKSPPDLWTPPSFGTVGTAGGSVDRLFFAFHGDTRPKNINDVTNYPTQVIQAIYQREAARNVQFAVDLGDHLFASGTGTTNTASQQMAIYMSATKLLGHNADNSPKVTFMTMGNHECTNSTSYCFLGNNYPNYTVYMAALAPISSVPYYTIHIGTSAGPATFVFIADNAWDSTQKAWLESTLSKADTDGTKYTIVMRHHPIDNTDLATLAEEWTILQQHKYTLFLNGHTHEYKHDTFLDSTSRTLRMGIGGAPFDGSGSYYGYGTVQQETSGNLTVRVYDEASDSLQDAFGVVPQ